MKDLNFERTEDHIVISGSSITPVTVTKNKLCNEAS